MAGDPRWELRQAIRSALLAASPVTALVSTRIYDDVPEEPTFPFIVLDTISLSGDEADKTNNFTVATAMVYVWSTYQGYKEVEQISSVIYNALQNVLVTVTGYDTITAQFHSGEEGRDNDGITRYSGNRFVYKMDPS